MLMIQPVKYAEQDSAIVSDTNDCGTSCTPTLSSFAPCVLHNSFKILGSYTVIR